MSQSEAPFAGPRKLRKLRKNVQPLLADDETLIGAIVLQSGAKTLTLTLLSVLLSPIIGMIGFLFFRKSAVLITTDKQTRLYGVSLTRTTHPTKFIQSVTYNVSKSLKAGSLTLGSERWRVEDGWEKTVNQFSAGQWETAQDVTAPAGHDAVLTKNRQTGWAITALVPLLVVGLFAGGVFLFNRPNAFSVSYQASERYCGDGNYGDYLAVETRDGAVMVTGFTPNHAAQLDFVHSKRDARFGELVRGWRDLKGDVDVVCMSTSGAANSRDECSDSANPVQYRASRWDHASNTRITDTTLMSTAVPCDSAVYNYPSEQAFDMLLCAVDACRVS